ncbi:MAG: dephospho-CoA kinase [bacterium]|nr:MAG: dephospho-CoA kinase [bacterium]
MIVLGLTGSIGMGKSTTTAMFADAGALVWNADDAVHRLYAKGGAAVGSVEEAFPGVVVNGAVDRTRLAEALGRDGQAFARLEAIVHPLVLKGRLDDLAAAEARGLKLAVLDIPLLFETGGDATVDAVVVVTAPAAVQAARVLDAEKRRRADFVIDTSVGLEAARARVDEIVGMVLAEGWTPPRHGLSRDGERSQ